MAKILDENLTDKQVRFCEEYIKDLNGCQAAIRAGYSQDTAQEQSSRLLSKVKVKLYIKKLIDDARDSVDITVAEIVNGFKEIAFDETSSKNHKLRAFEDLAKYKGLFVLDSRIELSGKEGKPVEYKNMSDEDLKSEIAKLMEEMKTEDEDE